MKKPQWLEKEKLYSIMFESERPAGRVFDLTLMTAISLSIIISFVETIPSLARTFQLILETYLSVNIGDTGISADLLLYGRVYCPCLLLAQASRVCAEFLWRH